MAAADAAAAAAHAPAAGDGDRAEVHVLRVVPHSFSAASSCGTVYGDELTQLTVANC